MLELSHFLENNTISIWLAEKNLLAIVTFVLAV